jgi:hypothetical protein
MNIGYTDRLGRERGVYDIIYNFAPRSSLLSFFLSFFLFLSSSLPLFLSPLSLSPLSLYSSSSLPLTLL